MKLLFRIVEKSKLYYKYNIILQAKQSKGNTSNDKT